MATRDVARWAVSLTTAEIPSSVSSAAESSFYNYIGCAFGGSNHEATPAAIKALTPIFGPATSTILSPGNQSPTADPLNAAFINGIASHVHDYDDTHLETIIHPTGPVASALLAYAEYRSQKLSKPVSGEEFLLALTAGIEAECKLGLAVWPSHYDLGWHITCTVGCIGAAIAVGKLMGLSEDQMTYAIGLASCQVVGHREHFGSHAKSFGVGRAAQGGLQAALFAESGMTSSEAALEGKRGWVATVCPDAEAGKAGLKRKIDELKTQQGSEWETAKNAFKPFPCGIVIHPVIDGCCEWHQHHGSLMEGPDKITSVKLRVHPLVLELTGKKTPRDGLEGKFSVYHSAAVGLVRGKATPAEYADSVVQDPQIVTVRDRIEAEADSQLRPDECKINIAGEFQGEESKMHDIHVKHAVGSLVNPMSQGQLTEKFVDQVAFVFQGDRDRAKRISDMAWSVRKATDMANFVGEMMSR